MPRDSSGNVSLSRQRAVTGQVALAEQVNVPFDDVQALFNSVAWRDGLSPMTGNLNMNGFKLTGLGEPTSPGDAVPMSYLNDPWAFQPIGAFVAYDAGESLAPPPKTDTRYRYVLLTAGQTGTGAYNNGILTTEVVSGIDPNISATAVVSLAGSPFNGKTIRLINTERRFIRPGAAGTLEDSQNAEHTHGVTDPGHNHNWGNTAQDIGISVGTFGGFAQGFPPPGKLSTTSSPTGITINNSGGAEARPRSIGVVYYRRIL